MLKIIGKTISFLLVAAVAGACEPVKYVLKGEPAPCTGYIFTPEKEKQVRLDLDYNKDLVELLEKKNNLYKRQVDIEEERIRIMTEDYNKLHKAYQFAEDKKMWYFVGGMLLTGLTVYLVKDAQYR